MPRTIPDLLAQNEFDSRLNKFYFLNCLSKEYNTCKRTWEDVSTYCIGKKFSTEPDLFEISDLNDFKEKLKLIELECQTLGYYPIVQIEAHGHPDYGLNISRTAQNISWPELIHAFREINIACKNNLNLVFPSCYGYQIILYNKSIKKPAPFYSMVAPFRTIQAGVVENIMRYYAFLLDNDDWLSAFKIVREDYYLFHSEYVFLKTFKSYFLKTSAKEFKQARVESLLTQMRMSGSPMDNLSEKRNVLKKLVKNYEAPFYSYKNGFLLASDPSNVDRFKYTYDDFLEMFE